MRAEVTQATSGYETTTISADTIVGEYRVELTFPLGRFGQVPVRVVRDEDGTVLASDLLTDSYGLGFSPGEALAQLAAALERHFAFLTAEGPERLSERLAEQLAVLSVLSRRSVLTPGSSASPSNQRVLAWAA